MKILTVNTGSSSVKCKLYGGSGSVPLARALVERVGQAGTRTELVWDEGARERRLEQAEPAGDHAGALEQLLGLMVQVGLLASLEDLSGVGHRVVHGGERFQAPVLIDAAVVEEIRELIALAPLHNPAGLAGIEVMRALAPRVPQVAVFDTAFHQGVPPRAHLYPIPLQLYREHGIRRYGFHGTSHAYVFRAAARFLHRSPEHLNAVTLHLGNGASAAAVRGGRSIDTSMGMTPLEGLMMGSRSGDLDPALPLLLQRLTGRDAASVEAMLNHESGLKGVCGANDMRTVRERARAGDESARLALEMFAYRVRKYIGAYAAALGRLDAVVFTGGIGENDAELRTEVCGGLPALGIAADAEANQEGGEGPFAFHARESRVALLVIPTDEEGEIARCTRELIAPQEAR